MDEILEPLTGPISVLSIHKERKNPVISTSDAILINKGMPKKIGVNDLQAYIFLTPGR